MRPERENRSEADDEEELATGFPDRPGGIGLALTGTELASDASVPAQFLHGIRRNWLRSDG